MKTKEEILLENSKERFPKLTIEDINDSESIYLSQDVILAAMQEFAEQEKEATVKKIQEYINLQFDRVSGKTILLSSAKQYINEFISTL